MMGWYGTGTWGLGSLLGMGFSMVLIWGLVIFGVAALLRPPTANRRHHETFAASRHAEYPPPQQATPSAPLRTLDERFARGEVSEEEYRRTREILQRP